MQAQEKEQEADQQRDEAQQQRDEAQRQRAEVRTLNEKLQATQDQLRSTLYAAHMNLAQHAWENNNVGRVVELLEQHRPKAEETDLRGFEWHYLYRLCHAEIFTLQGAGRSVVFSPNGKRLASASGDNTVKLAIES